MGSFTAYSITAAIILAVEYIVYKSLLANTTFHRLNRTALRACYIIALTAVPVWHFLSRALAGDASTTAAVTIDAGAPMAEIIGGNPEQGVSALWKAIPAIYIIGMIVAAAMTLLSYRKMFRVIRNGQQIRRDNVTIVVTDTEVSPFSWGRYIVVSPEDADNEVIIAHETVHVNNRDTIDLIFAQLFIIFNWFNPAAYLMRRELSVVHEYEVDKTILESGINASDYQMLLIKKTAGLRFQSVANSLNHSQLKNRLTMMLKSKTKRGRALCAAALLPAALLAVSMTDIPAVASTIRNVAAVNYDKVSENNSSAQKTSEAVAQVSDAEESEVNTAVQQMPEYPGGLSALMKALSDAIKYPENLIKEGVDGRVVVRFVVNTDGTISDFSIVKSAGNAELDAEAIRAIKYGVTAKWTPGMDNGKPVRCSFTLPVNFSLKGKE